MKDKYGKPLVVGARVAFNCSSEVCIGTLIAITPAKRYSETVQAWSGEPYHNFDIRHQKSKNVSRVRRAESIVVI